MKAKLLVLLLIFFSIACTKKQSTLTRAFSPNGDGINDQWRFSEAENDPDAVIKVFTKDGLQIFQCSGSNPVWDGRYGDRLAPSGMYYYTIQTKSAKDLITGSLMLI